MSILESSNNGNTYRYIQSIKQLCRDSAPLINLFQYKENYKQKLIQQLLNEDLTFVLKGIRLKYKRSTIISRVPKSNESFVHTPSDQLGQKTDSTDRLSNFLSTSSPAHSFRIKRGIAAFILALALIIRVQRTGKKSPFSFGPRQAYPIGHHKKGSFLSTWLCMYFTFTTGIVVIVSIGPQIYACIKQGKLKTLVSTMALCKVPSVDALNGTLPLSAPIIPNEGHAKYVCLDPWINALVTLASLGTIVAFLMIRCRKRTLCRARICHSLPHICFH